MKIKKDTVAFIDYTLFDTDGSVMDESQKGTPLGYLHGHSNLIPGLEKELEGKSSGDRVEVTIPAAEAYGEVNDALVQEIPMDQFPEGSEPQPGMRFQAQTAQGNVVFQVKAVQGRMVTVDGNHELAGKPLRFSVEVQEVRDATDSELQHGHVHGPGCNHG